MMDDNEVSVGETGLISRDKQLSAFLLKLGKDADLKGYHHSFLGTPCFVCWCLRR